MEKRVWLPIQISLDFFKNYYYHLTSLIHSLFMSAVGGRVSVKPYFALLSLSLYHCNDEPEPVGNGVPLG